MASVSEGMGVTLSQDSLNCDQVRHTTFCKKETIFGTQKINLFIPCLLLLLEGNNKPTPVFLPGESCGQRSLMAAVHGVPQSQTRMKRLQCIHALEKEMAMHSSILAWRIPGTEEPGGLPSMGSHRVGPDWSNLLAAAAAAAAALLLLHYNKRDEYLEGYSLQS